MAAASEKPVLAKGFAACTVGIFVLTTSLAVPKCAALQMFSGAAAAAVFMCLHGSN